MAADAHLQDVARDLRNRSETLLERWATQAGRREYRLVLVGDAALMEWAAAVIEREVESLGSR